MKRREMLKLSLSVPAVGMLPAVPLTLVQRYERAGYEVIKCGKHWLFPDRTMVMAYKVHKDGSYSMVNWFADEPSLAEKTIDQIEGWTAVSMDGSSVLGGER